MHRIRTALLAAAAIGAGIPAIASAQMGDRRPDGEQRGGERPDRGQGGQRPEQGQRPDRGQRPEQAQRPQAQQVQAPPPQQAQQQPQVQQQRPPAPQQAQAFQGRPDGRNPDRGNNGQRPQGFDQQNPRGFAGRDDRRPGFDPRQGGDPRQGYGQRPGFDQRPGNEQRQGFAGNGYRGGDDRRPDFRAGGPQGRVGADWRNDRRYDWRGYRDQHRETFHVGRYVPPRAYYNYGYRAFDIGFRLDPFFYASNYWIDDPYDYRLPPVWGSYRWVRYYDDVLLVDLASGEVIDVIHNFFW